MTMDMGSDMAMAGRAQDSSELGHAFSSLAQIDGAQLAIHLGKTDTANRANSLLRK